MTTAHDYAHQNQARFQQQLIDLCRIPSVSTDPERKGETLQAAEWVAADMRKIGLNNVQIMPTPLHPVVYGEWLGAGPNAKTVLVYGHYDVQPAVTSDGWDQDPFEPTVKDGVLYCRGSSDDKGQMFAQLKAFEALLANGKPTVNVKFLIEGEEEIGSPNLGKFVAAHRELLMADVCVISDGSVIALDRPSIGYSTRGLMYLEMEVFGAKQDLHSGAFGGIVHNPAQALAEIIAQLHNPDGSVAVPGFYDHVVALSAAEREELAKSAWTDAEWKEATGVPAFWGEKEYLLHERIGARPTLEINGFVSGFYGAGSKTVLPGKALAKISCRLVANQNADQIFGLVRDHILRLAPPTVRVEVRQLASAGPALMDLNSPYMAAASRAYEKGWGQKPVYERGGGTLPILADFQRELNQIPIMLMGFGLQTDGAHGPNEHFVLEMLKRGIDTAICFFDEVGQIK